METILLFLPTIFSFLTGILIAWGIYLMFVLSSIALMLPEGPRRLAKKWCICFLGGVSLTLFLLLFLFTGFAAFHISTILFIEIWYMSFLYRVNTAPWSTPCDTLIQKMAVAKVTIPIHKQP